jgi:prophage regulatory protein
MEQVLLRLGDVQHRVGLRRSAIYNLIRRGDFPPPIRLGSRCSAWVRVEVDRWIAEQVVNSRVRNATRTRSAVTP